MDLTLKYGRGSVAFTFPEYTHIPEYREPAYEINKAEFILDFNQHLPSGSANYLNVAVVVSDKTRLCGYPEYLPWLVEVLATYGAKKENITFYIAYGTHARQTEEESLNSYGQVYKDYRFVQHDCTDVAAFENRGATSRGTPVAIRKDILQSSLLITFGSISHHYFAGYGGGRKLLFPGLALKEAVYHNHGLFLDLKNRTLSNGCQPGKLEGNPLAEDLKEIDDFMPPKISVHGILNSSGKVCRLITGKSYEDFTAACRVHDSYFRYAGEELYDLVVASGGGYPKDINFIQAHKAVHHSAAFVRDGGTLIVLTECIDRIGSNYFMKYLETGSFEAAFSLLERHYEGNGGTALSMMTKTSRIKILMLTLLDDASCHNLGVTKVSEFEIRQIIANEKGSIAAIRNASMLVR
jgi:nickel-dependent lactate racemase